MKKIYLTVATGILAMTMAAQQLQLNQVIVLNEGAWGGPVTVGAYDPALKTYSVFDTVIAGFASDVIIDNGFIYVAADSLLIKYDLNTKQKLNQQSVPGIRELTIWNNQVLVTRASTNSLSSYFQAYDKSNLNFIYELTTLSGKAAEVKTVGDTAYIAVSDWGTMGKLAVVDLNNKILNREIDLGPDGLNPENVEVGKNGKIYTVNSLDWTNASVTKYDVNNTSFLSQKLNIKTGCAASALSHLGNIYFQAGSSDTIMSKSLGVYDGTGALGFWDTLMIGKSVYGLGMDSVNGRIYTAETDYFSYGKVFMYDFYGALKDSFDVGISPGTFAFDVRNVTGTDELNISDLRFRIYPNPGNGKFTMQLANSRQQEANIEIYNLLGEKIYSSSATRSSSLDIDLTNQASGIYFLTVKTSNGIFTEKLVKQ